MGAPAKFLFDDDFSAESAAKAARAPSAVEIAEKIADAEQRGYRSGFAAGQAEAHSETQRRTMQAMERIAQALDVVTNGIGRVEDKLEAEAVGVALSTARKLAGALTEREPLAELTALVAECFREVRNVPHLAIRVHDSLYENAKAKIEQIARNSGFEGRLIILAEPDIAPGDCTIEWADGGMVRERAAIEARIDELVGRYLAARDEHGGAAIRPARLEDSDMSNNENDVPLPELDAHAHVPDDLEEISPQDDGPGTRIAADLEAVFDVPVQVSAVLGRARMDVGELLKLGPGAVLELDRRVGEAIDIYVNNRLVARGEVVLVEDKLGVTMTEIIKADRG